jgi:hypothetical protein
MVTRKSNITLLFLFFSILTCGQENKLQRFLIGVNFSPDYCYRALKNNDGSSSGDAVITMRNDKEVAKFGFTAGINVCYNFSEFLGLETGIQYSDKGYQTKMYELVPLQPDPSLPVQLKIVYDYYHIDIPLKINFTLGKKRLRFCTGTGITTNIFLDEKVTSVQDFSNGDRKEEPLNSDFDYNAVKLSLVVSAGVDYKINDRMKIKLEPTFRYGLLPIIDAPVTGYLWSAGANVSYWFGFRHPAADKK